MPVTSDESDNDLSRILDLPLSRRPTELSALISSGPIVEESDAVVSAPSPETWRRWAYRYYNTVSGLTMSITAAFAADLACYSNARDILDPNPIRRQTYDIADYAVYCAILIHLSELVIARLGVLSSRAGEYYDANFGPSSQPLACEPMFTRLWKSLHQIGPADVSKFIFATSESFIFMGSSVLMFQTLFDYLLTTLLGLSSPWSWSFALGITVVQIPALVLNMLAFLHETDKSAESKPLSGALKAGVVTISATTAVGSTLNDAITFIHLYVTNLSQVLHEGMVTKISIYSSIAFVSINAVGYRLIKQWLPRLSTYLPNMPQHICGTAIVDSTGSTRVQQEKSSFSVAAELMVALFKLATTFFNMLVTLYRVMRLSMSEMVSYIVGGVVAFFVGAFSMIAIASTYYKMPPKETETAFDGDNLNLDRVSLLSEYLTSAMSSHSSDGTFQQDTSDMDEAFGFEDDSLPYALSMDSPSALLFSYNSQPATVVSDLESNLSQREQNYFSMNRQSAFFASTPIETEARIAPRTESSESSWWGTLTQYFSCT